MKYLALAISVIFLLFYPALTVWGQGDVAILSPAAGEGLQGRTVVTGYIKASNVREYRLEFGFQNTEASGWYLIQNGSAIPGDGTLGIWDTTTISDGNYRLRLKVVFTDGTSSEFIVDDLRVRNYSVMETSTPNPAAPAIAATATKANLFPVEAKTKKNKVNPVSFTETRFRWIVGIGIILGILFVIILFLVFSRHKDRA